ncbi:unnamed protein product [Mytilus edulis]|uniref:Alpha-carbonic anhydrase domain-containing protein n=1 Tax=Mytilus edulis TaxID=6550 RepID=A0A8S3Q7H3_MYTED|nr:unnamed protein product [Mytilus edulis]
MEEFWIFLTFLSVVGLQRVTAFGTLWTEWWTYSGVSGPRYWGIHNPDWSICNKGKYQSPINIDPKILVHDPHMKHLNISQYQIDGLFKNNGHDVSLLINNTNTKPFYITGGPLSYKYTLYEIKIHFGDHDSIGSEHSIGGKKFPLEIQLYGYNADINKNISQALNAPHGIAALSILAQVTDHDNDYLDILIRAAIKVRSKGMTTPVLNFFPKEFLPVTPSFVTYEGSLTRPGCMETVTWVILNKPIHVSHSQLESLRSLTNHDNSGQSLMENNFRITMPSHGRLIRTNIKSKVKVDDCYSMKLTSYEVNSKFKEDH